MTEYTAYLGDMGTTQPFYRALMNDWLKEHCQSRFEITTDTIIFSSKDDLALFLLHDPRQTIRLRATEQLDFYLASIVDRISKFI